jgi:hypothetical protein
MKLTAEDYRQTYQALSDEEFLAIDRDELVDLARRCYDTELKRRQLEPAVPDDVEEEDEVEREPVHIASDEELVRVAVISQRATAMEITKMLRDANLPSLVTDDPKVSGKYAESCFGLMTAQSCADSVRDLIGGHLTWNNQELVRRWFERDWVPEEMDLDDFSVTVDEHFGEENKVAARITVSGVHPQTEEEVEIAGIAIVHLSDGAIGEHWIKLDQ